MTTGQWLTGEYLKRMVGTPRYIDYRPAWMQGLELDFFYPELRLAVEFNGDQHYHHTDYGSPLAQQRRDRKKKSICALNGITLVSLKAIDLQFSRLRSKFKKAIGKAMLLDSGKLTALDRRATEYRHGLIAKYNSPTARRQGKAPAKAAAKANYEKFNQSPAPSKP